MADHSAPERDTADPSPPAGNPLATHPVASLLIGLLVLASIACALVVPIYARVTPHVGDFPFFYFFPLAYMPGRRWSCGSSRLLQRRARQLDGRPAMSHVNGTTFTIVVALFILVTGIGFAASRWRPALDMMHLNEWGLAGRGFGTFITWFLLGGDLYTAYTFIAVPALGVQLALDRLLRGRSTRSWPT